MKQNIFFSCVINVMCLYKTISTLYVDSVSSLESTRSVVKMKICGQLLHAASGRRQDYIFDCVRCN